HGPQRPFNIADLLMQGTVAQRRAAWSEDRRRVGRTLGLMLQEVGNTRKRNWQMPTCEGSIPHHRPLSCPYRPQSLYAVQLDGFSQTQARRPAPAALFRLHLREPEVHVHLIVHTFRNEEMLTSVLCVVRAAMKPAQSEMTMRGERPHAARLAERQRFRVVSGGAFGVKAVGMDC